MRRTPPSRSAGSNSVTLRRRRRRHESGRPRPDPRCRRRQRNTWTCCPRRHNECTSATSSVSMSGSVAGSTPWPRLKMCPAAPASTAAPAVVDDGPRRLLDHRPAGQQHHRIEVALQRPARADPCRRVGQRGTPVHADHGGAASPSGFGHRAEQLGGADAEVGHRDAAPASVVNTRVECGSTNVAVIGQRQRARPRVEHLDGVHPGGELRLQEPDGHIGQRTSSARARSPARRASSPWCARAACSGRLRPDRTPA